MIYGFGPRARRVYAILRDRIGHDLVPGVRLPSHRDLASEFGVAPMTVRQVLSRLEDERLVSRQLGRGTFVRTRSEPSVLIIQAAPIVSPRLTDDLARTGFHVAIAHHASEALAILESDSSISLVLCELRLPPPEDGAQLIATIQTHRPTLPVVAIITGVHDLHGLLGTAAWPLLTVPTPIRTDLFEKLVHLVVRTHLLPLPDG
jgi:DNA-binding transcriptional regulator YhcF (GntR family)